MNSLNIVSRLTTTPPPSPPRSRTGSSVNVGSSREGGELDFGSIEEKLAQSEQEEDLVKQEQEENGKADLKAEEDVDEKTPLLSPNDSTPASSSSLKEAPGSRVWALPRRISQAIIHGVKVVFTTITAPGRYVIACFYNDQGHFSAILPLRNFKNFLSRRRRKSTAQAVGLNAAPESAEEKPQRRGAGKRSTSVDSNASSSTAASSDGEGESGKSREDSPARHTRSRTAAAAQTGGGGDEIAPQKKSIKIKLQPDEALRKRRAAKAAAASQQQQKKGAATSSSSSSDLTDVALSLKSPTSHTTHSSTPSKSQLTRYPRAPAPPRPLVPRRQPSYTMTYPAEPPKKTLIIDLDETLIHSMAKGGRMSTGHMVEVRLGNMGAGSNPVTSSIPSQTGQPPYGAGGVPILYYVHERPHTHTFLRAVSKWYNLVIFTASVQEYADPVIDWLERERKYFWGGRFYRQHCTLRNGAYIKDLARVEPDLGRVVILDNSPMSYIFHEDNAIPIEGWISDPTDNDLLHLIPLLEGLQYVTDVRALLALRQGQASQA